MLLNLKIWTGLIYLAIFFYGLDRYIAVEYHIQISNGQYQHFAFKISIYDFKIVIICICIELTVQCLDVIRDTLMNLNFMHTPQPFILTLKKFDRALLTFSVQ